MLLTCGWLVRCVLKIVGGYADSCVHLVCKCLDLLVLNWLLAHLIVPLVIRLQLYLGVVTG